VRPRRPLDEFTYVTEYEVYCDVLARGFVRVLELFVRLAVVVEFSRRAVIAITQRFSYLSVTNSSRLLLFVISL